MDPRDSEWIGVSRLTKNIAEVSAYFHALQWILSFTSYSDPRKDYDLLTNSEYCVRLLAEISMKGRCNKVPIAKVRRVLTHQQGHNSS